MRKDANLEDHWRIKLVEREQSDLFRTLTLPPKGLIDFTSNDYLGLAGSGLLDVHASSHSSGAKGSRLLGGNYPEMELLEHLLAEFHASKSALVFNSGFDANVGLLSTLPHRHDILIYDEQIHASMREGIRLSGCKAYAFRHNDLDDLRQTLTRTQETHTGNILILAESLYSMDGDLVPLAEMVALCKEKGAYLILDEAHATGIIGKNGEGLFQHLDLAPTHSDFVFRVITFGKALGAFGAAVLAPHWVKEALINFCRNFIYTTALPPMVTASVLRAYEIFPQMHSEREHIQHLQHILQGKNKTSQNNIIGGAGAIAGIRVGNPKETKMLAHKLRQNGFDVRAIVPPTVKTGTERIRICLHSYNTVEEVEALLSGGQ